MTTRDPGSPAPVLPDEPEATALEEREAAALARALDGVAAGADTPEDALAMAALLRAPSTTLGEDRAEALLRDALAGSRRARPRALPRGGAWAALALAAALALLLAGALLVPLACRSGDTEAAAFVERSRGAHAEADRLAAAGDLEGACRVLEAVAEGGAPEGLAAADARVLLQDLAYHRATLELGRGRAGRAEQVSTRALELGRAEDAFTANLLIARAKAREALGQAPAAGADYHDALLVTEALLGRALGGDGGAQ